MVIPAVFSTNNEYAPYLGVALQSLKAHTNAKNDYHIYVLYTRLSDSYIRKLSTMSEGNINLHFVDISSNVSGIPFKMSDRAEGRHLAVEMYYRIFIPEILSQYQKVLYLDCDLITRRDVADLFKAELNGNPVGAVYSAPHWVTATSGEKGEYAKGELFNSGVLLIDTAAYNKHNILEEAIRLIETGEEFVGDQDVLRRVLTDKVTYLDNHWNFPWHFLQERYPSLNGITMEAYEQVKQDPYIVHFTSHIKPWNRPDGDFAEYFWEYARQTIFYEEILYHNFNAVQKFDYSDHYFSTYLFPFDRVRRNSNIALYAAGQVGYAFYNQIKVTGHCSCVIWVDTQFAAMLKKDLPVVAVDELTNIDFDAIVIAVENLKLADNIRLLLMEMGIPESKIIWENPVK